LDIEILIAVAATESQKYKGNFFLNIVYNVSFGQMQARTDKVHSERVNLCQGRTFSKISIQLHSAIYIRSHKLHFLLS